MDENPYRAPVGQALGPSPAFKVLLLALSTVFVFVVLWVALSLAYQWFGIGQKVWPPPATSAPATH